MYYSSMIYDNWNPPGNEQIPTQGIVEDDNFPYPSSLTCRIMAAAKHLIAFHRRKWCEGKSL